MILYQTTCKMSEWRFANPHPGINFGNDMFRLLDFHLHPHKNEKMCAIFMIAYGKLGRERVGAERFNDCGVNNGCATAFFHSHWDSHVIKVFACICKASKTPLGCNARPSISNTGYGILKQFVVSTTCFAAGHPPVYRNIHIV